MLLDIQEGVLLESLTKLEKLMQAKDSDSPVQRLDISEKGSIEDIVDKLTISDLIASVWFKKDTSDKLRQEIIREKSLGLRDRVIIFISQLPYISKYLLKDITFGVFYFGFVLVSIYTDNSIFGDYCKEAEPV